MSRSRIRTICALWPLPALRCMRLPSLTCIRDLTLSGQTACLLRISLLGSTPFRMASRPWLWARISSGKLLTVRRAARAPIAVAITAPTTLARQGYLKQAGLESYDGGITLLSIRESFRWGMVHCSGCRNIRSRRRLARCWGLWLHWRSPGW